MQIDAVHHPATPAELKLFAHALLSPQDASFNLAAAFRITGGPDVPRLRRALGRLGAGIRALNTTFEQRDGVVHAVYRPCTADPDDLVPVTTLTGEGAATVVDRLTELADTPLPPDAPRQYDFHIHQAADATYVSMLFSHLVADGYSHFNLVHLLGRLYADPEAELPDSVQDSPSLLVEPKPAREESIAFYRERLGHADGLGDDRLLGHRTADGTLFGEERRLDLGPELSELVRRRAEELGCTPFTFFLSAYLMTYARTTGGRQPVVGIPVANRQGLRQRAAFGYYVNTLPLGCDLTAHRTFADLCRWAEASKSEMLRHQGFDLSAHVHEVCPKAAGSPLSVDQAFTYYRQPLAFALDGCEVEQLPLRRRMVKYPMSMNVEDLGDRFAVNAECSDEHWHTRPLEVMRHVVTLVAADPDRLLTSLPALPADAERALDALVNADARPVADDELPGSLADWFTRTAAAHATRTAVVHEGTALTYGLLDELSDKVAAALAARATGPYVGVSMRRGPELIAVILGVLKAGKAYVPLDPNSPSSRIGRILDAFPEGLTVVEDEHRWPEAPGQWLDAAATLEDPTGTGARVGGPAPAPSADDTAYVIFTSGSTGKPKGVQVTHRNVMTLMRACEGRFGFGPEDTWSLFHSYAFDFSVWEVFGALLYGGRLAIVPETVAKSPEDFRAFLVRERVTVLNQTPSAFGQLLKVLRPGDGGELAVRYVVFGGEALRYASLRPWYDVMGDRAVLVNMYGITETTVHVTFHAVTQEEAATETASLIGRPLPHLTVRVVDEDGHVCPPGVPGEIVVGGAGVTLGYLGRPELTAERFPVVDGRPLYRSGDLGVVRADGTLVHLGRIDQQVQLRGFRIELGEVESAFLAVTGVQECAVRLDERDAEHPALVAFVTGAEVPAEEKLRHEARLRLPSYMVPSRIVRTDALPLTINGKVDTAALPWPQARSAAARSAGAQQSGGDTEAAVRAVWTEVLGTDGFGADDNFFDIGGTSMHVVQVHQLLVQEPAAEDLQMIELFTHTTVRRLAAHIESIRGTTHE
ncbi:non-ribosomal peptide synthetase [Streptomyces roseicoloratus]|uniref:non-ribosomal peptide synthetase n=1 Tax=Streptomyces roseicoloratus TaxID=2508722 RepID=UPI0013E92BDD|nr:non-ribosomal peptide synthetase [Streptomyces roseicoloratus]